MCFSSFCQNIVLKQIGSGTSLPSLLARVRTSFASNRSMGASVQALRQFHRAALAREQAVLSSSKLRRLERSTGVGGPELQRLWACFLQGEQRWPTLVSGVINDLVHFRIAFGEAVFPPHAPPPPPGSAASAPAGNGHQRQRSHSRLAMGGPTPLHESPRLWQGSGIVQATLAAADAAPCRLCVPPLPPLFHMDGEARPLQSCPRCTWLSDSTSVSPGVTAAIESTRPTASSEDCALAPFQQCTCGCSCISRVSGLETSVFGRLFLLLDGRSGLHRGYLDFEDFVAGCKIFTASNRAQRLRAVFRMALLASADGRGDDAEQAQAHVDAGADAAAVVSAADQSESHVVRGRVSRAGFTALVALFEELYHGHSYIAQPVSAPSASPPGAPVEVQQPQPQPQIPASLPASWLPASPSGKKASDDSSGSAAPSSPALLLSSQASSRMFVDAMFEKAAADRQRRAIQRWERGEDLAEAFDPTAATDLSPTGADGELDSLSYESFAHCIVLHPLISNFFRLDELAA